jgi:hypothetical protein
MVWQVACTLHESLPLSSAAKRCIVTSHYQGPMPAPLSANKRPPDSPLPTDWKSLYRSAINEQDPEKKPGLCDLAVRAINERILNQAPYSADAQEIGVLEDGLRQLTLHKQRKRLNISPTTPSHCRRGGGHQLDANGPTPSMGPELQRQHR